MSDQQIRRHPPAVLRVTYEHPSRGERAEAVAWDASLGGMFLETGAPLEPGALVTLELTGASQKVSADARVLSSRTVDEGPGRPVGMAVRFLDLPDDVAGFLQRTLLAAIPQERTILGVGGATKDTTTPGVPAPDLGQADLSAFDLTVKKVSRATQIGVAPQANVPTGAPKSPSPAVEVKAPASEPRAPVAAPAATPAAAVRARAESPSASAMPAHPATPSSVPPPPRRGGFGTFFMLLVLGGAAGAVYFYRDVIAERLAPTVAAPSPATTPSTSTSAVPNQSDGSIDAAPAAPDAAAPAAEVGAITDAGHDSGHEDAGRPHDAGARDAGHRDGGARDGGKDHKKDAGRPH